jgi:hypothetical protein
LTREGVVGTLETTVSRPTRTPEVISPLSAPLAALVMLIVVILILPL